MNKKDIRMGQTYYFTNGFISKSPTIEEIIVKKTRKDDDENSDWVSGTTGYGEDEIPIAMLRTKRQECVIDLGREVIRMENALNRNESVLWNLPGIKEYREVYIQQARNVYSIRERISALETIKQENEKKDD